MHILIAHDLTPEADLALQRAAQLARQLEGRLTLLHVQERETDPQPLRERLQALGLPGAELRIAKGQPSATIASQAEGVGADLLVLGAHHKSSPELFAGTTLERLARSSRIPLLLAINRDVSPYQRALVALDFSQCACAALHQAHRLLPSEAELYAQAETLMNSEDPDDWQTAKAEYLEPLLSRFPESERRTQVQQWIDRADLELLERQVERLASSKRDPRNESERLLVDAWRRESEDRMVAAAKYRGLIQLKEGEPESRLYVALAKKRLRPLEVGMGLEDDEKTATVEKALAEADRDYAEGNVGKAKDRWNSIVVLYGDVPELTPYVRYAQARLAGEAPVPPISREQ